MSFLKERHTDLMKGCIKKNDPPRIIELSIFWGYSPLFMRIQKFAPPELSPNFHRTFEKNTFALFESSPKFAKVRTDRTFKTSRNTLGDKVLRICKPMKVR